MVPIFIIGMACVLLDTGILPAVTDAETGNCPMINRNVQ